METYTLLVAASGCGVAVANIVKADIELLAGNRAVVRPVLVPGNDLAERAWDS